jgi:hypothetical protein
MRGEQSIDVAQDGVNDNKQSFSATLCSIIWVSSKSSMRQTNKGKSMVGRVFVKWSKFVVIITLDNSDKKSFSSIN